MGGGGDIHILLLSAAVGCHVYIYHWQSPAYGSTVFTLIKVGRFFADQYQVGQLQ